MLKRLTTVTMVVSVVMSLFVFMFPRPAHAVEQTTSFDSVDVVENPDGWTIQELDRTIDGVLTAVAPPWPGIYSGPSSPTGVVIDYAFNEPQYQVTRLRLYNQAGGILTDADGIGTATLELLDPDGTVLFTGSLNAGNGGAPFDTALPTPVDNVATVRLSDITVQNPGAGGAAKPLWREFQAIRNVAFPEMSTEINPDGISDDVTVTGTEGLEGALDWTLFGPVPTGASGTCDDADWATAPVFESGTATVTGDGVVTTTPTATPTTAGCYSYADILSSVYYSGDVVSDVGQPAETFQVEPSPGINLEKIASPNDRESFQVGQEITYTFTATNTGNVPLTNVTVNDTGFTGTGELGPVECPGGNGNVSLDVGAQVACTATYTLTQADIDAGSITNQANADADPTTGEAISSPLVTLQVPGDPQPGLTLAKTADPDTVSASGEIVTYTFVATNTGNVTLTDVQPEEFDFTGTGTLSPIECPPQAAVLLPSQQVSCIATYEVTQADINAGEITNVAIANGLDEDEAVVTSDPTPPVTVDTPGGPPPSTTPPTELPFTGTNTTLLWVALGLTTTGIGLTLAARRSAKLD